MNETLKITLPKNTLLLSDDRKAIVNADMAQSIEVFELTEGFGIYAVFPRHLLLLKNYETEEEAKQVLLNMFENLCDSDSIKRID